GVFAIIPFTGTSSGPWSIGDVNAGILFVFALTSIGVYGISLAGWASGSKFPLLGSVRSTAQMISYELSMSMSVIGVLILAGSTALGDIVNAQYRVWFIVPQIIGGFHTEYSGLRFGLFFIAEYLNMITVSCLATLLFLGGWNSPIPGLPSTGLMGLVWFLIKAGLFLFFYIWLRSTLPRFRYDRLMAFGWKVLLPIATLNLMVTAALVAVTG